MAQPYTIFTDIDDKDRQDLGRAVQLLETRTFADALVKVMGKPVEWGMHALPQKVSRQIGQVTLVCMRTAFRIVLFTVDKEVRFKKSKNFLHKSLVVGTGAVGGFFGGTTMAVELPISTGIMMRSVAEIAREEGEDLNAVEPRLACIAVLGLGGSTGVQGAADASGYYFVRKQIAAELIKAAEYLAANSAAEEAIPVVVRLMNTVAERFGIQLSEKVAAELVPVIGAVSGATLNALFIDHFQRLARGHFIIRRLERKYGTEHVESLYKTIAATRKREALDAVSEAAATLEP